MLSNVAHQADDALVADTVDDVHPLLFGIENARHFQLRQMLRQRRRRNRRRELVDLAHGHRFLDQCA